MPVLEVDVAGLTLRNPTMLASGVLGTSAPMLVRVYRGGAGAVVTKSIGLKPRAGFPNPTIAEVEGGYINAMGLPNPGAREFAKEIKAVKKAGVTIIASVYGFTPDEFAKTATILEEAGSDAIELNLSCPHVEKTGAEIGSQPDVVSKVIKTVKGVTKVPVFAKIGTSYPNIPELARVIEKSGADGITAINTVKAIAIDVDTKRPILANVYGGLSGPVIKPIALRCVYEAYESVSIPIIGVGGVRSWQDAVQFILAGASAVQIGTAIAKRGLGIFKEIVTGLERYLEDQGLKSLREIVGLAHGE